jgi:xanthine dehydrogenase/oxidase
MHACDQINMRVQPFRPPGTAWAAAIAAASGAGVDLQATGFTYAPPTGTEAFNYCSYGAACVETLVDTLTGESLIERVDLLFDAGKSLNPMIDVGQIEGGFLFGCGYEAFEDVTYEPTTGRPLNGTTWEYKPPSAYDLPGVWNTTLLGNAPNPLGVLGSKATGEPGVCLGSALVQSLEQAVEAQLQQTQGGAARFAAQITPFTPVRVQQSSSIKVADMKVAL